MLTDDSGLGNSSTEAPYLDNFRLAKTNQHIHPLGSVILKVVTGCLIAPLLASETRVALLRIYYNQSPLLLCLLAPLRSLLPGHPA